MNKWQGVVAVAVFLLAAPVWAAGGANPEKEEQFKARKAREIQNMEEKLACLKAANTPAEVKRCHEAQKMRHQTEQLQRIQEQRKKLDAREQNLKELQEKKAQ
ncbi:MAG: hypothetical protein HQL98_02735 [Magnetococcales bacterium]|nr:hypothetical protein [Magnetococcales bacterium]